MTEEQARLVAISEECGEIIEQLTRVQQRCFKAIRFGLDEAQVDKTNRERLHDEINDLFGAFLWAENVVDLNLFSDSKQREKVEKLEKYHKYSKELGEVK